MKRIPAYIFLLLSYGIYAQGAVNSVNYIKIDSYNSPSLTISSIDDFIKLMNDNKTQDVFMTANAFLIQGPSIMYTIGMNGYKNVADYKTGNDKVFTNGASYYFALENNLPNQAEVDYYKGEAFLTNADYQEATRLGFTHSDAEKKNIYGLITREDFQRNIRYLNRVFYLKSYRNWQALEDQAARQNVNQGTQTSLFYANANDRERAMRDQENARVQRERRDQEGVDFLENTDIDFIIEKSNNAIKKLDNFDYYYINLSLDREKDSIFFYACKFCQYTNISDYKNNNTVFSLKNTNQIISRFAFASLDEMLDADKENVKNGTDYNLMWEYYITLEQLDDNRGFINELEAIKQKYLQNYENGSNRNNQISVSEIKNARNYNTRANSRSIYAFAIYSLLKQSKGTPVTYSNFVTNVQREYGNITIFRNISFDANTVSWIFRSISTVSNLVVNNPESQSFYLKQ